jgi:hypothetical protein
MAKYIEVDGEVVEFPDNMSDQEIEAAITSTRSSPNPQPVSAGSTQELIDKIPMGGGPGYVPAPVENQIQNPSWFDAFMQGAAALPITSGLARGVAWGLRGRAGGTAAENIARQIVPRTGKQLAAEGVVGGAAGVAAQQMGQEFPEGWQRDLVSMATGAAVSAPLAMSRNAQSFLTDGLNDMVGSGTTAAKGLGSMRANQLARTAVEANPNLVPSIVRATEIEQTLGASLPTLARANGDTSISNYLQSQTSRVQNTAFTAEMKLQYQAAEEALQKAKKGIAPSMEEVDAFVKNKAVAEQFKNRETQKVLNEALEKVNTKINNIGNTSFYNVRSGEEIGAETRNLINTQRRLVQSKLSPEYDRVLKDAEQAGISLSGEQAKGLRDFVTDQRADNVFQSFPRLYGQIQKQFKPKTPTFSKKIEGKYTFAKPDGVASDVSIKDLDSLKREVNSSLRNVDPQSPEYRYLSELRTKLDDAIDTMPDSFKNAYRAVDERYYQEIGIPYRNAEGVLKIDRAKFEQQVTPTLTKNPESLREALTAMGKTPEAYRVAEDAFMLDLSKNRSIFKVDGSVNPAVLQRYIKDNKTSIEQIPGLKAKLEGIATDSTTLVADRERILTSIEQAKEQAAESLWSRAYGTTGGLAGLVRNGLSNPREMDRLLAATSGSPEALDAVKAAVVKDLTTIPGDRLEVFKQQKVILDQLFGQDGSKKLLDLVEASQRIRDNPLRFSVNVNEAAKTGFERATGSKIEQTVAELRNPIIGQFRVMANNISRFFSNTSSKSEAQEVQRFLRNLAELPEFAAAVQEVDQRGYTQKALRMMGKVLNNYSTTFAGGAAAGFVGGRTIEDPEAIGYTPTDPSLLEGFAGNPRR